MSLRVNHLTKVFGDQRALDDISFEVTKGEILGFLGPNGAGKSTTMKIATCYLPPTSGSVEVCGYDILESPDAVRQAVGYLPEHNPLYLDMYVWEYLAFTGKLHGLSGDKLMSRIAEIIDLCGLTKEQHKKIETLSKGYRQRVGLAQALLHDPEVLILDEPTTGLDPNQILEIRSVIKNISHDKTVIFSTHIMQEVQALCDRVIVINNGRIVANDRLTTLKTKETKVARIQVEFAEEAKEEALLGIVGVRRAQSIDGKKFILEADLDSDVRPLLFQFAQTHQLTLLGLHQDEVTMEDVFKELTKKPN